MKEQNISPDKTSPLKKHFITILDLYILVKRFSLVFRQDLIC